MTISPEELRKIYEAPPTEKELKRADKLEKQIDGQMRKYYTGGPEFIYTSSNVPEQGSRLFNIIVKRYQAVGWQVEFKDNYPRMSSLVFRKIDKEAS